MSEEKKEKKERFCPWCGTEMRGRAWPDCPRGRACKRASDEHDDLMARIERVDPGFASLLEKRRR